MNKFLQFSFVLFVSAMVLLTVFVPVVLAGDPYAPNITTLPKPTATPDRINTIMTVVFIIIGALSVLMFVVGGMRYISSQGDPQQIARAKGTLVYALVGLLVSISAVSIVTFVLGRL